MILLTGAAGKLEGYIGSRLLRVLEEGGCAVRSVRSAGHCARRAVPLSYSSIINATVADAKLRGPLARAAGSPRQ